MSHAKVASLTSSLLAPKGRAAPAALVDQVLGESRGARGDAQFPDHSSRWQPAEAGRPREAAVPAAHGSAHEAAHGANHSGGHSNGVVLPLPTALVDDERHGGDLAHRKKLSLRLEPMRHFRLKLVSYHLGISAQELLTRALDRYIDAVAPELAQTLPLAGVGLVGLATHPEGAGHAEFAAEPSSQGK
jgi:hypothetical protein